MNALRRNHINKVIEQLNDLQSEIEEIFEEEDDYKDNMPENLSNSERYEKAEDACSCLEDAGSAIDDVISNLEEALE